MNNTRISNAIITTAALLLGFTSCKKLIDIPPPISTVTTQQVFASQMDASAAISGIYSDFISGNTSFAKYSTTVFCGLSADELIMSPVGNQGYLEFSRNNLFDGNVVILNNFWTSLYANIYRSNAILEGLESSVAINDSIKSEMVGEVRFIRAFCNFYLVNLFGGVPLVTSANWRKTNLLSRATVDEVYQLIITDLKEAKSRLASGYSVGKGERIVPNKTAATALLSRVYLFHGDWANAEAEASSVINTPGIILEDISNIFSASSKESIWQLKQNNALSPSYNGTPEGVFIRPRTLNASYLPQVWVSESLLNKIESGDLRKEKWIDSTRYSVDKKTYYFPGKYTQGPIDVTPNGAYKQYYMVLRLAEQFLIRAEAFMKQNRLKDAIADINRIRQRAGLDPLDVSASIQEVTEVLIREKQIEFLAEWGHRWLDLKRWGLADRVLAPIKGDGWQPTDQLWPIPATELGRNPNLNQNEGY